MRPPTLRIVSPPWAAWALLPLVWTPAGPVEDRPAFAPGAGLRLTKAYAEDTQLTVEAIELTVAGRTEEPPPGAVLSVARRAVWADEYLDLSGGRVERLRRGFDRLGLRAALSVAEPEPGEIEVRATSPLEGSTVRFEWNAVEGVYDPSFQDGGDSALLDDLAIETDLKAFLPDGPVSPDDTWDVDPARLSTVFAPGGDLRFQAGGPAPQGGPLEPIVAVAAGLAHLGHPGAVYAGEVRATYRGNREVDGVAVGRIELELDVSAEVELDDALRAAVDRAGDLGIEPRDLDFAWTLAGEGQLLWNLERGHLHSWVWEGEATLEALLSWDQPAGQGTVPVDARYWLAGASRCTLELDGD